MKKFNCERCDKEFEVQWVGGVLLNAEALCDECYERLKVE